MKIKKKLGTSITYGASFFLGYSLVLGTVVHLLSFFTGTASGRLLGRTILSNTDIILFPFSLLPTGLLLRYFLDFFTFLFYIIFGILGEQRPPPALLQFAAYFNIAILGAIFGLAWYLIGKLSGVKSFVLKGALIGIFFMDAVFVILLSPFNLSFGAALFFARLYYPLLMLFLLGGAVTGYRYGKRKPQAEALDQTKAEQYIEINIRKYLWPLVICAAIILIFIAVILGMWFF